MDDAFRQSVHAESTGDLFNMNALMPGTPFMERLDAHLLFLIRHNMAYVFEWQELKVIYSGSSVAWETATAKSETDSGSSIAGDASFKIFEEMRCARQEKGATDVLTHGVYTTQHDAPLHALATREPYIYLVKEKRCLQPSYLL